MVLTSSLDLSPDAEQVLDFRADAASMSVAALKARRIKPDSEDLTIAGLSLCVPAPISSKGVRRTIAICLLFITVFGFGLLLIGGMAKFAKEGVFPDPVNAFYARHERLLLSSIGVGVLLLTSAMWVEKLCVKFHLKSRGVKAPPWAIPTATTILNIEDPNTAHRMKMVCDDVARMFQDPARKLVVFEGISCRYVLRSEDIVQLYQREINKKLRIVVVYRVAGTDQTLSLLLAFNSAALERKRQMSGWKRAPLSDELETTLAMKIDDNEEASTLQWEDDGTEPLDK